MNTRSHTAVPLRLSAAPRQKYDSWPVSQGIPFADGVLQAGTPVRIVDSGGSAYPTQSRVLTTWAPDSDYVKWLLIDTQLDVNSAEADENGEWTTSEYSLEYGPDAVPPAPENPVVLTNQDGRINVDTGMLRVSIPLPSPVWERPEPRGIFEECAVRVAKDDDTWRSVGGPESAPYAYMTDQYGKPYRSDYPGLPHSVSVEEHGPLRACICIRGHHWSMDGERFCPYTLRLHFFAGSADVRVFHTFVFDQDPHRIELGSIGLRVPATAGRRVTAAVSAGGERTATAATNFECVTVRQSADGFQTSIDGDPRESGEQTAGWAFLSGSHASAAVAVKDFRREYPKGLSVDPYGIDVAIRPETAEPLPFSTPFEEPAVRFNATRDEEEFRRLVQESPTAPLNLKSLNVQSPADLEWVEAMVEKYAPDRAASHNDTGTNNGVGAAKTTEIVIRYSANEMTPDAVTTMSRCVDEPLLLPADPEYACRTEAYGPFYHGGDPRFADVDDGLDYLIRSVAMEPIELGKLYGMMRYGNMVCSHSAGPAVAYVYYKDTDPVRGFRHVGPYNNEANDQIMGVWGNFLRTARRDHFRVAAGYSRAIADVGIVHAHPSNPNAVGLMHYHNCHQWSGGFSPSHTLISGILTDYYVTGNRRLLEVAQEVGDWAVRRQEPAGIISCRHGRLHREFTGPLWCLFDIYQATWARKYGELARRSLNWFLRATQEPGMYPVSVYTRGADGTEAHVEPLDRPVGHARDLFYVFEAALRLFPSRRLKQHIIAEADYLTDSYLTDNFVTPDMARRMLTERSQLWEVDNGFYWTQWGTSGNYQSTMVALAYRLTGDLKYAAYAKDHLLGHFHRLVSRTRKYADWRFTWIGFGSYIPRLMRIVADAMDADPEGLEQAEAAWKKDRADSGNPVYEGPGADLDVDTMDTNGNILNRPPADLPREAPPRQYEPLTVLGDLSTDDLE